MSSTDVTSDDKGLRAASLNLGASIVVGVSSTAPGYSIAATLGYIVAYVSFQSPAIVLLGFLPILGIAYAYRELNRETPDCGTTFTWGTRVFNPWVGWMGGWGYIAASIIGMASVSQIAGQYFFLMFGLDDQANSAAWVTGGGVVWIIILTWVSWKGVQTSARLQYVLLTIEMVVLLVFSVIALTKVYTGNAGPDSVHPQASWFNPFAIVNDAGHLNISAISGGILLSVFLYWGWDSSVSLNEETIDPGKTPGRAAVLSTVILLGIYVLTSVACLAYVGADSMSESDDVLAIVGEQVLGANFDKFLIFAVLTSAAASTQTTIMPTARTLLSMAAYKALPKKFADVHKKNLTPGFATIFTGAISIVFFVGLATISTDVLGDATEAVGLLVAFYYGMTGFSAVWHFRHRPGSNAREILTRIIAPLFGGLVLLFVFIKTAIDDYNPENSTTTVTLLGHEMGTIFVIAVGSLLLGVVLMLWTARKSADFFAGKVLNRHTPIVVAEHVFADAESLGLPDASDRENTVISPE